MNGTKLKILAVKDEFTKRSLGAGSGRELLVTEGQPEEPHSTFAQTMSLSLSPVSVRFRVIPGYSGKFHQAADSLAEWLCQIFRLVSLGRVLVRRELSQSGRR